MAAGSFRRFGTSGQIRSRSHTFALAHSHTLTLTLPRTHTLTLSHSRSLTYSYAHMLTRTLVILHSRTVTVAHSRPLTGIRSVSVRPVGAGRCAVCGGGDHCRGESADWGCGSDGKPFFTPPLVSSHSAHLPFLPRALTLLKHPSLFHLSPPTPRSKSY